MTGKRARAYCRECETRIGDVYYRPRHLRGPMGTLLATTLPVLATAVRALAGERR